MIFNKEELVLSLQEKANEKIEGLRQAMAESLFADLHEETFFVFDTKSEDVIGGPFATKQKAQAYVKELASKDAVIMTEKALESKMGIKVESASYEKDLDPNKKIVVSGVKGMNSKPFTKKFKNMAAYEKWTESEEFGNYEVSTVVNEALGSEGAMSLKDLDSVLTWFADNSYLDQEFEFDNVTGVLTMNGKAVATKGKDGSYSVDITACGNVGLKK
jgi:hypothetical protein